MVVAAALTMVVGCAASNPAGSGSDGGASASASDGQSPPPTAGAAAVALDPDHPLDPDSREVHLLVTEQACASGQVAEGRVRLAMLTESEDTVDVAIGVEPLTGDATCPSNPPTPFVVELDEPLGERLVRDLTVDPPQEIDDATDPGATANR
jgi:hypothetical protein